VANEFLRPNEFMWLMSLRGLRIYVAVEFMWLLSLCG